MSCIESIDSPVSPTCGAQITAIAGHLGVKKTTNKIKQKFYWYRLKDSVKLWIHNCTVRSKKDQQ